MCLWVYIVFSKRRGIMEFKKGDKVRIISNGKISFGKSQKLFLGIKDKILGLKQ